MYLNIGQGGERRLKVHVIARCKLTGWKLSIGGRMVKPNVNSLEVNPEVVLHVQGVIWEIREQKDDVALSLVSILFVVETHTQLLMISESVAPVWQDGAYSLKHNN